MTRAKRVFNDRHAGRAEAEERAPAGHGCEAMAALTPVYKQHLFLLEVLSCVCWAAWVY